MLIDKTFCAAQFSAAIIKFDPVLVKFELKSNK
jgi:hypothetical protein